MFYARLTELAASGERGAIDEVTSPDDNLQAVFQYLVKSMSDDAADGDADRRTACRRCSPRRCACSISRSARCSGRAARCFSRCSSAGRCVIAVILRIVDSMHVPAMRVNGAAMGGPSIFGLMIWLLFLRFIVPILGVFYGTSLIADEVEDKTITYLFTRPIPRAAVLLGKYLAYLACTVLHRPAVGDARVLPGRADRRRQHRGAFPNLVRDLGLLAVGLAAYGALFAAVGAWLKRPLLVGLFFAFGWEPFALAVPAT